MSSYINNEKAKKTIAHVIDRIRTSSDKSTRAMLEEYRKIFKKEVAFFHRSTVGAYLLMLCDQGKLSGASGRGDFAGNENRNRRGHFAEKRPAAAGKPEDADSQRYPMTEEESKRLFFSAGRSRRVFPREILGLITAKTSVSRDDIGVIRILDNYSFVQVRDTSAEEIIRALDGVTFRGRPLTVNYAKSRKDGENGFADGMAENGAAGGDDTETFSGETFTAENETGTEVETAAAEYTNGDSGDGYDEIVETFSDTFSGSDSAGEGYSGSEQEQDNPDKENI